MLPNAEIEFFPTLGQWCQADFLSGETGALFTLLFTNVILLLFASVSVSYLTQSVLSCFVPSLPAKMSYNAKSSTLTGIVNIFSLAVFSITASFSIRSQADVNGLILFIVTGSVLLLRWLIILGIGKATGERELAAQMQSLLSSNVVLAGMVSCATAFFTILFPTAATSMTVVLEVLIFILVFNYIIAELRTFIQFQASVFCTFLYLCTLDLLPILLAAVYGLSI